MFSVRLRMRNFYCDDVYQTEEENTQRNSECARQQKEFKQKQ